MKIAIVTGASSGIGQAAARRLASSGFQVLAGVRKAADAAAWERVPSATPLLIDVTLEDSVNAALKKCRSRLEKATEVHLVNNAGIAVAGPVEGVSLDKWKEQFEVNVFGLIRATQAFLPFIRATKGRVVNISSASGLATSPYLGPYSASKFAVEAISDALRREIAQFGCRVVVVEPGPIDTPIWNKGLSKKDFLLSDLSDELQKVYGHDLATLHKAVEKSARDAVPVGLVADVVEKALLARRPRTRYIVGTRALHAQMAAARFAPDRLLDALVAMEFR
jgi:NAD(P)-dependent dehydrogenase (short-subunit alcohol dehydrogenase family)